LQHRYVQVGERRHFVVDVRAELELSAAEDANLLALAGEVARELEQKK